MANKIVDGVTNSTKLPVSYKDFVKDPVKAVLCAALVVIVGLYVDVKVSFYSQINEQNEKIEVMEAKVDNLSNQMLKVDSTIVQKIDTININ